MLADTRFLHNLAAGIDPTIAAAKASERLEPLLPWAQGDRRISRTGSVEDAVAFSIAAYPWLKHLYEETARTQVCRKGAQLGLTERLINRALHMVCCRGGNVFIAVPPGGFGGDFSRTRLTTAVNCSPRIAAQALDIDNVGLKMFRFGNIFIRGTFVPKREAGLAAQLSSVPADMILIDEFDRVPPGAIIRLRKRLLSSELRWEDFNSTPTFPGVGIDRLYQRSTMYEPEIRCAACGKLQMLTWALVKEPGILTCPLCHKPIDRHDWDFHWVAAHPSRTMAGYWIPRLVNPAADLLGMMERSKSNDPEETKAFWNEDLGLPFEPAGACLSRAILQGCVSTRYTMPQNAERCALGVDVQLDRLVVWGRQKRGLGRYGAVCIQECITWDELAALLVRYDALCVIDKGGRPGQALDFASKWQGRVYLARYVNDLPGRTMVRWDTRTQECRIARSATISHAQNMFSTRRERLPGDFWRLGEVDDPTSPAYQLCQFIRVQEKDNQGRAIVVYPKTGREDHYGHAHVYAVAASIIAGLDEPERGGGFVKG